MTEAQSCTMLCTITQLAHNRPFRLDGLVGCGGGGPRRGSGRRDLAPARLPPRGRRTPLREQAVPSATSVRRTIPDDRVNGLSPPRHRAGRAAAAAGPRRGVRLDAGGPWRGGGRPPARWRAIPAAASHGPVNRRTGPRRQTAPAAAADGTRRDIRPDTRRTAPRRKAVVRTCIKNFNLSGSQCLSDFQTFFY